MLALKIILYFPFSGKDDKGEMAEPGSKQSDLLSSFSSELKKVVKSAFQQALQSAFSEEAVTEADKSLPGIASREQMATERNCAIASKVVSENVSSSAVDGIATRTESIPAVPNKKPAFSVIASYPTSPGSNTLTTNIFKSEKDTHSAAVASFTTVRANGDPLASASLSSALSNSAGTNPLSVKAASEAAATRDHVLPVQKTDVDSSRSASTSGSLNVGGINTLAAIKMDTNTVVASTVGISSSFAPHLSNTKLHSLCTVSKPLALTSATHLVSSSYLPTFSNVNTATESIRPPPVKKPNQVRIGQKEPGFNFGNATNLEVPQEFDFIMSAEVTDKKPQIFFTGVSISQPVNQYTSTSYAHTTLSAAKTDYQSIRSVSSANLPFTVPIVSSADLPFTVPSAKSSTCQVSASFQSQYGQSAFVPVVPSSSLTEPEKHTESSVADIVLPSYSQISLLTSHSVTKPGASQVKSQRSLSTAQQSKKIETLSGTSPSDFAKPNDNAYLFSAPFTCPLSFQFGKSAIPAVIAFGQSKSASEISDGPNLPPGTSAPGGTNSHQSSAAPGISGPQPTSAEPGKQQIQPAALVINESEFHSPSAGTDGSQLQQATARMTGSLSQLTPVAFGESQLHPINGGSKVSLHHPTSASLKESEKYPTAPTEGKSTIEPTTASKQPSSQKETAEVANSLWQLSLASGGGSQLDATSTAFEGLQVNVPTVTAGTSQPQTSILAASAATPGKSYSQQTKAVPVSPLTLSTFVPTGSNTSWVSGTGSAVVLFSGQKCSKEVTKSLSSSFGLKHISVKHLTRNKTNSPNSTDPRYKSKQVSVTKKIRPRLVAQSAKDGSCSVTSTSSSGLQLTTDPPVAKSAAPGSSVLLPKMNSSEGTVNKAYILPFNKAGLNCFGIMLQK